MRIAATGRYARRDEIAGYMRELADYGHIITSRWLSPETAFSAAQVDAGLYDEYGFKEVMLPDAAQRSINDIEDFLNCDTVVNFTDDPMTSQLHGARHAEFGGCVFFNILLSSIARRMQVPEPMLWQAGFIPKRVIVVGYREIIHHCLPMCEFYPTWEQAFTALTVVDDSPQPSVAVTSTLVGPGGLPIRGGGTPQLALAR